MKRGVHWPQQIRSEDERFMAKANSPEATWDPAAYILRGQHCPTTIIRETLEYAMKALGARRVVHIAFHNRGIIGSLSFTLGYPRLLGEKLTTFSGGTGGAGGALGERSVQLPQL